MTTTLIFMRYSDVGITWGLRHESEEQIGRGGEAAGARGTAFASGAQASRSGGNGRRDGANGIPLERCSRSRRDRCTARHEQRRATSLIGCRGIGTTADCTYGRTDRAWFWYPAVENQAGG